MATVHYVLLSFETSDPATTPPRREHRNGIHLLSTGTIGMEIPRSYHAMIRQNASSDPPEDIAPFRYFLNKSSI